MGNRADENKKDQNKSFQNLIQIIHNKNFNDDCYVQIWFLNVILPSKISQEKITEIITDAVNIEIEFICDALPCKLIGMNSIVD